MINLSTLPLWVLPGLLVFIFGLGVAVNKLQTRGLTGEQVDNKIRSFKQIQAQLDGQRQILIDQRFEQIEKDIEILKDERQRLWEIVRENDKKTDILISRVNTIAEVLSDIKAVVNTINNHPPLV